VLARISRLFSFALERDWITANPASRIRKPGEERSRDRVLPRDEVRELWAALHETEAKNPDGTRKPRLSHTLNEMLIVMLLTAQRRGEVCTMRWRDVDLQTAGGRFRRSHPRTLTRIVCRSRRSCWRS
jgi:integrase